MPSSKLCAAQRHIVNQHKICELRQSVPCSGSMPKSHIYGRQAGLFPDGQQELINGTKSEACFRRWKVYLGDPSAALVFKSRTSSHLPRQQTLKTIDFGSLPKDREHARQIRFIHPNGGLFFCQVLLINPRIELMEEIASSSPGTPIRGEFHLRNRKMRYSGSLRFQQLLKTAIRPCIALVFAVSGRTVS